MQVYKNPLIVSTFVEQPPGYNYTIAYFPYTIRKIGWKMIV